MNVGSTTHGEHPEPGRVLIVRLSSIGDVVHAIPAYMALRRAWPQAEFGWAVEGAAAELVRALPGPLRVHEVPVQRWRARWWSPATWAAMGAARAALRRPAYDLAIDFQGLLKSALVARAATRNVLGSAPDELRERAARYAYVRCAPPARASHVLERNLHLAAAATGAALNGIEWPALCSDADRAFVAERIGEPAPILLHAIGNWPSKEAPTELWVETGRQLFARTGRQVLWVWGPREHATVAELATAAGAGNAAMFATSLPQLSATLERCAAFVGGDSGPLHLAVACGASVAAVFGPTDPTIYGPTGSDDSTIVRRLECSHCHQRVCPLGTTECLKVISPADIVDAVVDRLAKSDVP